MACHKINYEVLSLAGKIENIIEHKSSYPRLFMQLLSLLRQSFRTYVFGTATHHDPVFRAVLPPTTVSRLEMASRTTSAPDPTISNMVIAGTDEHESGLLHLDSAATDWSLTLLAAG